MGQIPELITLAVITIAALIWLTYLLASNGLTDHRLKGIQEGKISKPALTEGTMRGGNGFLKTQYSGPKPVGAPPPGRPKDRWSGHNGPPPEGIVKPDPPPCPPRPYK